MSERSWLLARLGGAASSRFLGEMGVPGPRQTPNLMELRLRPSLTAETREQLDVAGVGEEIDGLGALEGVAFEESGEFADEYFGVAAYVEQVRRV